MALFYNPHDPALKTRLQNLQPISGYCIFVDIVGSTSVKDKPIVEWTAFLYNAFANTKFFLGPFFAPLKTIGDCCMFFIPETHLHKLSESPLGLFSGLASVASKTDHFFKEVKIAATYCRSVFEITFVKNTNDVYGKDIDLTFRLLSLADAREIVMNEELAQQVRKEYKRIGNKKQFPDVLRIVGPWPQRIKGFAQAVQIYKLPAL